MPAPIIILTGSPGVGKTTVSSLVADTFSQSVVIEGDAFHRFLHNGKIPPWLPESHQQNTTITTVTTAAAAGYARDGWTTVLEGILGPWFLPTICDAATGLTLHYFVLTAPLETCLERFAEREPDGPTEVVEKMHGEFARSTIDARHLIDADQDPEDIADVVCQRIRRERGMIST